MATKNETKKETTSTNTTNKSSSSVFVSKFMNILAFAAVVIGGVALFLAKVLGWFGLTASWISKMQAIANAIGWLALCLLSIKYIKNRKKLWIWIVWIVAIIMIVIGNIGILFK